MKNCKGQKERNCLCGQCRECNWDREKTDAVAGNDLYLTIDKNLQEATYQIIERKNLLEFSCHAFKISWIMIRLPQETPARSSYRFDDVYHALFAKWSDRHKTFFFIDRCKKRQKKSGDSCRGKRKASLHCGSYVPTPGSSGCFLQITFQRNAGIYELYCRRSSDGPGRNPIFRCDRYKR